MLHAFLAKHGLKAGYWYYLRILWIEDGLSQKVLSERTNVAENTTVAMINGMIKDGLVERKRDQHDRRMARILLTDYGRSLEAELMHYAVEINRKASKGVSKSELRTTLSVLRRMSENLSSAFEDYGMQSSDITD